MLFTKSLSLLRMSQRPRSPLLFKFLHMPFGLRNAAQTFQHFIDHFLHGFDFGFAYIDDLLVASRDDVWTLSPSCFHFWTFVNVQCDAQSIKMLFRQNCHWLWSHEILENGIRPLEAHVHAICNFPPPTTKWQVQHFLGMVNFYWWFIPNCASVVMPLTILMTGPRGPRELLPDALQAFSKIKSLLTNATLLAHPVHGTKLSLMVDASKTAVGAVLHQEVQDCWQPLAFFSKKLQPMESHYSTFSRELLVIYLAIKHFQHFIEDHDVIIFTNHKLLVFSLHSHSDRYSNHEVCQLNFILKFCNDIRHVCGPQNAVADAFSHVPINALYFPAGVDFAAMANEQVQADHPRAKDFLGFLFKDVPLPEHDGTILCEVSTGVNHPFVPEKLRQQVFDALHCISHLGAHVTQKLIATQFVWSNMNKDIHMWAQSCLHCQWSKVSQHNHSPIGTFCMPDARFSHLHLDLVGPLSILRGCTYLLTCIDRFSCWPEAILITDAKAELVVHAVTDQWVAWFGTPAIITMNCGQQFKSSLFSSMLNFLGCSRVQNMAYHPATNGMVEHFHQQLKVFIMTHGQSQHWVECLPLVLLGIRSTIKEDLCCCPVKLVFATMLRLPEELIASTSPDTTEDAANFVHCLKNFMWAIAPQPPWLQSRENFIDKQLENCFHIFVRCNRVHKPLESPYEGGPFPVVACGKKHFTIQHEEWHHQPRPHEGHVRQLPCFTSCQQSAASLWGTTVICWCFAIMCAEYTHSCGTVDLHHTQWPMSTFSWSPCVQPFWVVVFCISCVMYNLWFSHFSVLAFLSLYHILPSSTSHWTSV